MTIWRWSMYRTYLRFHWSKFTLNQYFEHTYYRESVFRTYLGTGYLPACIKMLFRFNCNLRTPTKQHRYNYYVHNRIYRYSLYVCMYLPKFWPFYNDIWENSFNENDMVLPIFESWALLWAHCNMKQMLAHKSKVVPKYLRQLYNPVLLSYIHGDAFFSLYNFRGKIELIKFNSNLV